MENKKTNVTSFYLPDDIIAEILPRISTVKSLLRFKCVSKWWCSFISSEKFVNTHQLENSGKNRKAIYISASSRVHYRYVVSDCHVDSLFTEQRIDVDYHHPEINNPNMDYISHIVVGCCNGLCCLLIDWKEIIFWNPSTRKSHKLPTLIDTAVPIHNNKRYTVGVSGFGYDEPNNDYKVLVIYFRSCSCCIHLDVVRLYSLKTNSWKTIDNFLGRGILQHEGVFVNGKLHWLKWLGGSNPCMKIVSFNLGSEGSGLVELPSSAYAAHLGLGVIEGCLSVVLECDEPFHKEVWIMEVYGETETWRKLATLQVSDLKGSFMPICVSKEGEILFSQNSTKSLFIYNPKNELVRHPKINIFERVRQMGLYFQSLVSPFPDAEQMEHNQNLH